MSNTLMRHITAFNFPDLEIKGLSQEYVDVEVKEIEMVVELTGKNGYKTTEVLTTRP